MSKRHHASRRKAYGRRQHELHERLDRRRGMERPETAWDEPDATTSRDAFSFLDTRAAGLRFVLGD